MIPGRLVLSRYCQHLRYLHVWRGKPEGCLITDTTLEIVQKYGLNLTTFDTFCCSRFTVRGLVRLLAAAQPLSLTHLNVTAGRRHHIVSVYDVEMAVDALMEKNRSLAGQLSVEVDACSPLISVHLTRFRCNW